MTEYDFKPQIPVDHIMHIIGMVRTGELTVSDSLICVGSALGEVGAFLKQYQNPTIGYTPVQIVGGQLVSEMSLEDCCTAIERLLDAAPLVSQASPQPAAIDPALLALLIQLATMLFKKFF